MTTSPRSNFETLLLERLQVAVAQAVPNYVLHEAKVESSDTLRFMADEMVYRLSSHVMAERAHDERTIVEEPVYADWRDHLTASLPRESFRRRFLERYWGEPDVRRRTHTVACDAYATFPYSTQRYPETLGPVVRQVVMHDAVYESPGRA